MLEQIYLQPYNKSGIDLHSLQLSQALEQIPAMLSSLIVHSQRSDAIDLSTLSRSRGSHSAFRKIVWQTQDLLCYIVADAQCVFSFGTTGR